jgi:hypothetical protein
MPNTKPGWIPAEGAAGWLRWWDGTNWCDAYWPAGVLPRDYLVGADRTDISGTTQPKLDIVGENWRESEIVAALGTRPPLDVEVVELATAELIPEPDSPHDSHAVSVRVAGHTVGYLSRDNAAAYYDTICRFIRSGVVPTVRTRIWAVTRFSSQRNQEEVKSAIRIALPPVDHLNPRNQPPEEPYFLIPRGRTIQITGEENHFDSLRPYVSSSPVSVIVSLRSLDISTARVQRTVIEVALDNERIGQLTPASSASLLPLVDEATKKGRITAAWATIVGSHLAAEATLSVAKPQDLPGTWPSEADVIPRGGPGHAPVPAAYEAAVGCASAERTRVSGLSVGGRHRHRAGGGSRAVRRSGAYSRDRGRPRRCSCSVPKTTVTEGIPDTALARLTRAR